MELLRINFSKYRGNILNNGNARNIKSFEIVWKMYDLYSIFLKTEQLASILRIISF